MSYYQEGCNFDGFAYVSVLKMAFQDFGEILTLLWAVLELDFSWDE